MKILIIGENDSFKQFEIESAGIVITRTKNKFNVMKNRFGNIECGINKKELIKIINEGIKKC